MITQNSEEDKVKKILIALIFTLLGSLLFCQETTIISSGSNASAYSYEGVKTGVERLKIHTYVLGQVYKPGLYVVPDDTSFLTLLALAGGPKEDAKLTKIRIVRPFPETGDKKIIWINLKDYISSGSDSLVTSSPMKAGDTVILSGTIFYAFSKVADFLSKAAIALSVYNLVTNIK